MSDFSNEKKTFSSGLGSKKSSRLCINRALSCSPVWHLGHYSNVFNSKSNVIVTLSEHVDGNFQAHCGQRLQSTNHVVLRATISPWRSLDERHSKVSTHLHSTTNQKKDMLVFTSNGLGNCREQATVFFVMY